MPQQPDRQQQPTIKFHRIYPAAISPMRADKSALGLMPTMAYRHCEAMRVASSFGWYAFPAEEVHLRWNGADVFVREGGGQWQPLVRSELPGFADHWNEHAPEDLLDLAPPFLTRLPMPGLVQVWTGLLCSTAPGWSVLVRPPSNMRGSFLYSAFEGIIETDRYRPCPLFMNIQLLATDVDIMLPKTVPLLQVQPLLRETYDERAHSSQEVDGLGAQEDGAPALSPQEWQAYRRTIRVETEGLPPESGHYAADTRKRDKSGD
ncbi:hypothetical protein JNX00_19585 [Hydrogenophaga sp. YM1]|jgi:hypothetical protein|uniref:hypothetical protein n=1 Tax=unclassified Hydrogenophaga TaxID=2610897 RepID=UPI000878539C|nr:MULTISPECIES: hypothetical protein [unclassified Hydrogenophaga]MBN9370764.1 hypothetical protein [Hydrogenophaga sp.]OJV57709.1 MAG: hypothetical protein BGO22_18320 [Hydrogenophaga sp. 70-12]QRR33813.1 hypothetical protein JNX00_19585 [Hydrogenophaga sp. YM1]